MEFLPTCICVHDDADYLPNAIKAVSGCGPVVCFVSRSAWDGSTGDWETAAEAAESAGAEVVLGDWEDEGSHRSAALEEMRRRGHRYCLIPDGDEILEPALLDSLARVAEAGVAERVYAHMDTYWKGADYVVRPREKLTPIVLLDLERVRHVHIREYDGGRALTLSPGHGIVHHLSYVGPDRRIARKIATWGHRTEVAPDWFVRVWKGWDHDPHMRNLHPTHPWAYGWVERIAPPAILAGIPLKGRPEPVPASPWPRISVVVPLYGGADDIRTCLASLDACRDLLHETIVVDDCSPDDAAEAAEAFPGATVLRNERNSGFAASCNRGLAATTGEVVLFLNSDAEVPRSALVRMVEALSESGSVAAVGPVSDCAGHGQQIPATFLSSATMPLFAADLAHAGPPPKEVDMLVGFCLAVRRSVLDEVGGFDEAFGAGNFEDNDLCYRMRRAGYRLLLVPQAFVRHEGGKSLDRRREHPAKLLGTNHRKFVEKWREDVETGYASHLSGLAAEPIRFDPSLKPELLRKRAAEMAERADVTLCMIVRNEERVLADCLRSARGVFRETIVVDTGSTDRTKEIAEEFGATVVDFPWTDSFSEARNESLRHAGGRWVFWMDADDTLPRATAEALLASAASAGPGAKAFVVPVRFTDGGPAGGTQVDHVKLIRNAPGIRFSGHIHEQILPSLADVPGEVYRIPQPVLHSGYDTSEEGQARKRERDWKLLALDLEEDPEHPFYNFNMGMTCHFCERHEEAVQWLAASIRLAGGAESHVRKAYALMGLSLRELGRMDEAVSTFRSGLEAVGEDPELRFQLGAALSLLGEFAGAKEQYLAVQEPPEGCFTSIDIGILGYKRFRNLGGICEATGELAEADAWYERAVRTGGCPVSATRRVELALEAGRIRAAMEAHADLEGATGPDAVWVDLGVRIAAERAISPEAYLEAVLERRPYSVPALLALARLLLGSGREAKAVPILQLLDRLDVAEGVFYLGRIATVQGDLSSALAYMARAAELDPGHEETKGRIRELEERLEAEVA